MPTSHSQYLTFDRRLSRPNTFFWIEKDETIRCRIQVAGAMEVGPVDVHLRFRGRAKGPGLVHVRPLDETTFICEAARLDPDLPVLELVLLGVPEGAAEQIRRL